MMLGKLEEMVLLSLLRAGPKSPASKVYEILTERAQTEKSFGSVYTTLDRLVKKQFITEKQVENADKKGRTRRYFTISAQGTQALSESMQATNALAYGIMPGGPVEVPT